MSRKLIIVGSNYKKLRPCRCGYHFKKGDKAVIDTKTHRDTRCPEHYRYANGEPILA